MMKQSPPVKVPAEVRIPFPSPPRSNAPRVSPLLIDDYAPAIQLQQADDLLPRCGECEEPFSALIRSLLACIGVLQKAERDWNGQARTMVAGFNVGRARVHPSLDMGGDAQSQLDTQAKEMLRKATIALRARVGNKFTAEAATLGQEAAQKAQDAERALKAMLLDATSYQTLSASTKFSAKFNREALEAECRGRGIDEFVRMYQGYYELENDQRCVELELAAEPWLRETLTANKIKAAGFRERMTGRGVGEDVFQQVRQLLQMFDQRRRRDLPESVIFAPQVLRRLIQPAFIAIVGTDAWTLDKARMTSIIHSGGSIGDWELSDTWLARSIPTNV